MDYFSNLPTERIYDMLLALPYLDLLNSCGTNRQFRAICNDDNFWREKIFRDYGIGFDYTLHNDIQPRTFYNELYNGNTYLTGMRYPKDYPLMSNMKKALDRREFGHLNELLDQDYIVSEMTNIIIDLDRVNDFYKLMDARISNDLTKLGQINSLILNGQISEVRKRRLLNLIDTDERMLHDTKRSLNILISLSQLPNVPDYVLAEIVSTILSFDKSHQKSSILLRELIEEYEQTHALTD